MEHELQRHIVKQLIHNQELSFNELWNKEGDSNKFAYHVDKLEALGIIRKSRSGKYELTGEGRKLTAFIEGDTGARAEFPTISNVMLVKRGDKYLCQKRLKEPFYGVWGFPSGKINFGFNIFEGATRDLREEAGLDVDNWQLKAIEQVKTYENDNLVFHHILFHVSTESVSGELKEKTHKAENSWLTLDEYKKKETFPSEKFFEHIIPAEKPVLLEYERYLKNGKFAGGKLVRVVKF